MIRDSGYKKLISKSNLRLAWRRITANRDARYKRYFRHLYDAYELNFEKNIVDLHKRLRDGVFQPTEPVRIYYPKPSGLQRPITLLCLEDQILLQALANLFAEKLYSRRKILDGTSVFSNWLNDKKDNIFFVQHWKNGYHQLRKKMINSFSSGYCWGAKVDLSAFYETIPHDLLLKTAFPRGGGDELSNHVLNWLAIWSSDYQPSRHQHGIPQGPIASNFLAECILLPIDERMAKKHLCFRYVDDFWLLGKTELEVRQVLVHLDVLCRERGLIPNSDKMKVRKVNSADDLVSDIANIATYTDSISRKPKRFLKIAEDELKKSVTSGSNGLEVIDRTKLRYIYFRSPESDELLAAAVELWERYPEHVDAFSVFLENYERTESVIDLSLRLLVEDYPYDFVRGEMWMLLARMLLPNEIGRNLIELAIAAAKDKDNKHVATRMGAYAFLCQCEAYGFGEYSKWMMWENSPIVQSLLAPNIVFNNGVGMDLVRRLLSRTIPDPALALVRGLSTSNITLATIGKDPKELSAIVQQVFCAVGIIPGYPNMQGDPIGKILADRYKIPKWNKWVRLFSTEYKHALSLLRPAETAFKHNPTTWLSYQASFNDALFRAFQKFLGEKSANGAIPVVNPKSGELYNIGNLYDHGSFKSVYPALSSNLKFINDRRNLLPTSHPYQKKTGGKALALRKGEQRKLHVRLQAVYKDIIQIADNIGI